MRQPRSLDLLASCIAQVLAVKHCMIAYSNAAGRQFWGGSELAEPLRRALLKLAVVRDELLGQTFVDIDHEQLPADIRAVLVAHSVAFVVGMPLRLQSGKLIGWIWLIDSAPRKSGDLDGARLESLARLAGEIVYQEGRIERLQSAQAMARVGTWHWLAAQGRVFVSPELCAMFDMPSTRFGVDPMTLIRRIRSPDRKRLYRNFTQVLASHLPVAMEFRVRRDDGTMTYCTGRMSVDADLKGRIIGLFGICQDVTDRQRVAELSLKNIGLEEAVRVANELIEQQRKFVAIVSHEFRTPLAVIDGTAHRLIRREHDVAPDQRSVMLDRIRKSVSRLVNVIESMLCATRLEAGQIVVNSNWTDLAELLQEICDNQMIVTPDRPIMLDVNNVTRRILADRSLLYHAFANLLSNAIKYSPDGGEVEIHASTEEGQTVVRVRDQGVGIPADEMPKLFSRFFRARTSTGIAGTGYGLHIVKSFVQLHGGAIEVESVEGEGSLFIVKLPC